MPVSTDRSGVLSQVDAMLDLVSAFEARAAHDPGLAGTVLKDMIRLVPGKRALLSGEQDGRAAVFRFHLSDGERNAAREWAELRRTASYMSTGRLRVNAPLLHRPELGLVVVAHAAGQPLMDRIKQMPAAGRAAFLPPAAAWLKAYTAPTDATAHLRLDGWYERAERGLARLSHNPALQRLKAAILVEMRRIAAPHSGGRWRMAICHGDFHPNNLLSEGATLTGIDTGGSARLPICKDIARFLVHMGRRGLIPSGEARFGVDRHGIGTFTRAFSLGETERHVWLPFMIGVEALLRVETEQLPRARLHLSEAFCETLLDELRAIDP